MTNVPAAAVPIVRTIVQASVPELIDAASQMQPFSVIVSARTKAQAAIGSSKIGRRDDGHDRHHRRFPPDRALRIDPPSRKRPPAYLPLLLRRYRNLSSGTVWAAPASNPGGDLDRLDSPPHEQLPSAGGRKSHPTQWRAFFAAYLGWMLDGFDFTIMTFLLVDISAQLHDQQRAGGAARHRDAGVPPGRRGGLRHRRRSLGTQVPADVFDPLVLGVRVPERVLDRRTECCSRSARCSASAWAASGRPGCRSRSNTGRVTCAAGCRGCCKAATRRASSCRR